MDEMSQSNGEAAEAKPQPQPQLVILTKAHEMAKNWVRDMSGDSEYVSDDEADDSIPKMPEGRPPRLGLGAKYLPHSKVAVTMSSVEKKLRSMTDAGKLQRKQGEEHFGKQKFGSSTTPAKESKPQTDSDDEEEDVKGSSQHGRQHRRLGSEEMFSKISKNKGSKRKR